MRPCVAVLVAIWIVSLSAPSSSPISRLLLLSPFDCALKHQPMAFLHDSPYLPNSYYVLPKEEPSNFYLTSHPYQPQITQVTQLSQLPTQVSAPVTGSAVPLVSPTELGSYLPTATHLQHLEFSQPIQPSVYYYASAGPSALPLTTYTPTSTSNNDVPQIPTSEESADRPRGLKRGRPTKNPVWTFFRRLDEKSVQCNMCGRLVKSACATNMSKHIERHHQNEEGQQFVDSHLHLQFNEGTLAWNGDRRTSKRNRRTKHPVWELFARTGDGQAQCRLCSVLVRSPCSSNFMGHLYRHHGQHYQQIYQRWLDGRMDSRPSPEAPRMDWSATPEAQKDAGASPEVQQTTLTNMISL